MKEEDLLNNHTNILLNKAYSQETTSTKIRFNLNHPVKELIWTVQDSTSNSSDLTGDSTLNTGGVADLLKEMTGLTTIH